MTDNDAASILLKECRRCHKILPLSEFKLREPYYFKKYARPRTELSKHVARCRACTKDRHTQYSATHKKQRNEQQRRYRDQHRDWYTEYQRVYCKYYRPKNKEYLRQQQIKYAQEHKEHLRDYHIDYYRENGEHIRSRLSSTGQETKARVLTHYGGGKLACVLCGEIRLSALTIDHINGGGNQERTRTKLGGHPFHRRLEKLGYPKGYRTLCLNCQFVERQHILYRNDNEDAQRTKKMLTTAKYRDVVKSEVLTHYSNHSRCACVACSNDNLVCLSIDHTNGGGSAHRRALGKYSFAFYLWLKKNNYPEGYRTLCMSCQMVKRIEEHENGPFLINDTKYSIVKDAPQGELVYV